MMTEDFLREAIRLSIENVRAARGGPFGAVVVRGQEIVGRGANTVTSSLDPTAHAEIVAIREACRTLGTFHLEGCDLYASCEPCPMCLSAVYWSRLSHLYFAASREDAAQAGFDDAFVQGEIVRPLDRRRLPSRQALREAALAACAEWKASLDKAPY
jgi:tRNA(Arg) A34 adenosine deaminase TadA